MLLLEQVCLENRRAGVLALADRGLAGGSGMESSANQITQLLQNWSDGDEHAIEQLMPLVYDELHRMARRYMSSEKPGHTLQATALVNEAYLRLVNASEANFQNRTHFFAVSAQVMRRILVDWARTRQAAKRGSDVPALELNEALAIPAQTGTDLVAVDDALKALALVDARKSQVVELRFFGGLSIEETAEVLKVSRETVNRDWRLAKSWLRRELGHPGGDREQPHGA
jgi:RNA polymerase sigma factor (TIGR02999 family)